MITVDEYYRMAATGLLAPDARVELLDGEIVEMAPIGNRHMYCVATLTTLFVEGLGRRALVWAQGGVPLNAFSEPQPDVALLRPRDKSYALAPPSPEDVALIVEVADSSVRFDRTRKVPMYLRAGMPEVWLVDLNASVIEVFIGETTRTVRAGDTLSPVAFPDITIEVTDLLV